MESLDDLRSAPPVPGSDLEPLEIGGTQVGDVIHPGSDIRRAIQACEMKARRYTYDMIAMELGYPNAAAARRAVQGALVWQGATSVIESREIMLASLDLMAQVVWRVLEANHVVVSNGRVVKHKGKPLKDNRVVLEAVDRLIAIEKERKSVLGLAAPARQQVTISHDSVDAAIAALEQELAQQDFLGSTG